MSHGQYIVNRDYLGHVAAHVQEMGDSLITWLETRGASMGSVDAALFAGGICLLPRLHATMALLVALADASDATPKKVRRLIREAASDVLEPGEARVTVPAQRTVEEEH